jgi:hypothetical protein
MTLANHRRLKAIIVTLVATFPYYTKIVLNNSPSSERAGLVTANGKSS